MVPIMANKRRYPRRKTSPRGRFQAIPINTNLALVTLADTVVLSTAITALSQDAWVHSADLTWGLRGLTAGQGPIRVGLGSGTLTVGQIAEALDASPASESDIIAREQAGRPVRAAGMFNGLNTEETLFDGRMKRTKLKFAVANSSEVDMWVRNESGAPLTTGAVVEVNGTLYLNWR